MMRNENKISREDVPLKMSLTPVYIALTVCLCVFLAPGLCRTTTGGQNGPKIPLIGMSRGRRRPIHFLVFTLYRHRDHFMALVALAFLVENYEFYS
jgi:hypothetical protein